ncbi:MAG TPA: DegT/DnrJ/EryC1/StrS family aminotransferase [Longimicrobiaceae bacterium]|nr:DegT/DnrJ/EryC1/StrS family aminotransferase [Longimicrobiaceae bacterium]
MAARRIPVAGPWITEKEIAYVTDAVTSAWYGDANRWHERFERAFAEFTGSRHAMALPSCTSAIHLSLLALGVGPGDEVIVPDTTWIASAAPISYVGATPVFADVDPLDWTLTAATVEACITPRTRAIVLVDLYGSMPTALDDLLALAERHGIPVVEDAAEALGSTWGGRPAGSFGRTGVFSFHGSKTLTTGEGGMLVTDDDALWGRVQVLRDHGRIPGDTMFRNAEVGWKYKMSSMQAALGAAQLERVDELVGRKREIFSWYREELADLAGIVLNHEGPATRNSYWMITAVLDAALGVTKEALIPALAERGIDSRPFFYPLSALEAYGATPQAAAARERNVVAYDLSPRALNLPSALSLTRDDVRQVCGALREVLALAGTPR